MALQDVNLILETMKAAVAKRQADTQLGQHQQQIDIEEKRRQDQVKQFEDTLGQHEQGLQLQREAQDLMRKMQDLQRQSLTQDIKKTILQGGPLPDGSSMLPTGAPAPAGLPPGAASEPQTANYNIPGIGEFTQQTPEAYATRQAELARISNAPAVEAQTKLRSAQEEAETARQLKVTQAQGEQRLLQIIQEHQFNNDMNNNKIRAEQAMNAANNTMHLRTSMASATGGMSEMLGSKGGFGGSGVVITTDENGRPSVNLNGPSFINNTISQVRDGTLSSDELKKRMPKQAPALLGMASEMGITPITQKEQEAIKELEGIAGVVPILHEMNVLRIGAPKAILIPGTDEYKRWNTLEDEFKRYQPGITRALSGISRFNNIELNAYADSLVPRRNPITSDSMSGVSKFNDFVSKDLQDAFNKATANITPQQRDIIRQRIGYNSLPYLGAAIRNPGSNPGTPQGSTPSTIPGRPNTQYTDQNGRTTNLNGGSNRILIKRKMADGSLVPGSIEAKDFNPTTDVRIQ